ncbi:methyltransferase domain-containing protein [Alienimonas sp. DA493]|uniref:methyltransferase domain-containing protein n=1 Tax=Alienimonas sp. DA493 TaxID=3373605 RepID=UPI00375535AD
MPAVPSPAVPTAPLAARVVVPEVMDDPDLDPAAHRAALAGLRRLNAVSGTTASLAAALKPILKTVPADRTPQVLDVACGGGDGAVALAAKLSRVAGRPVRVDGCDLSPVAVETAGNAAGNAGLPSAFFTADALAGPLPGAEGTGRGRYDAAVSSLFLHHLEDDDAPRVLANMAAAANAVIVSDLRRTRLGLAMAHIACRALSRSPIVHDDGPQSVRAAFTVDEFRRVADAAGLSGYEIRAVWPQRFLFVWQRAADGGAA